MSERVEKQLAQVPDDQLRVKLHDLTGEDVDDRLQVSYVLSTDPGKRHYGRVKEIAYTAEARPEEGNTVLIKVEINSKDLRAEHIREQSTISAKVECGTRSIGYAYLYQAINWVRKMWFRWF